MIKNQNNFFAPFVLFDFINSTNGISQIKPIDKTNKILKKSSISKFPFSAK